jgi:hypothetical protein
MRSRQVRVASHTSGAAGLLISLTSEASEQEKTARGERAAQRGRAGVGPREQVKKEDSR